MRPWLLHACIALLLAVLALSVLALALRAVFRGPVLKPLPPAALWQESALASTDQPNASTQPASDCQRLRP